jgi:hypothetical protein
MSFLSGLLKVAGIAAAPFSGGASLGLTAGGGLLDKFGKGAGDLGQVGGAAAGGAMSGRQLDSQNVLTQNNQANQQYGTHQGAEMQAGGLDLQRKNFQEDARGGRAKQALIASLLGGGFQPTSVNVPGVKSAQISGGLGASLGSDGAKQSMSDLLRQALMAQMQQGSPEGEQFSGGQVLAPPTMRELPKAGKMENIMGGIGLGGSLLASILPLFKKGGD